MTQVIRRMVLLLALATAVSVVSASAGAAVPRCVVVPAGRTFTVSVPYRVDSHGHAVGWYVQDGVDRSGAPLESETRVLFLALEPWTGGRIRLVAREGESVLCAATLLAEPAQQVALLQPAAGAVLQRVTVTSVGMAAVKPKELSLSAASPEPVSPIRLGAGGAPAPPPASVTPIAPSRAPRSAAPAVPYATYTPQAPRASLPTAPRPYSVEPAIGTTDAESGLVSKRSPEPASHGLSPWFHRLGRRPASPPLVQQDVLFVSERHYDSATHQFTEQREANGLLHYGLVHVMIPEDGTVGGPDQYLKGACIEGLNCVQGSEPRPFYDEVANRLRASGRNAVLVYVHGFNNSFAEEIYKLAVVAHATHFAGVPIAFDWPARAVPWEHIRAAYRTDVATIDGSRKDLAALLDSLSDLSSHPTIHLLAHSLGNRLLLRTLYEQQEAGMLRDLGQVILAAPDVAQAPVLAGPVALQQPRSFEQMLAPLLQSGKLKRVTVYGSRSDFALRASALANHGVEAAGHLPPAMKFRNFDQVSVSQLRTAFPSHDYFVSSPVVLADIREILESGTGAPRGAMQFDRTEYPLYSLTR